MNKYSFAINQDIKISFLDQKPTNTAKAYANTLRKVDEYEKMINKPIYEMTRIEIKEMLAMQFRSPSLNTITNNISIMRKYVDFCIEQNIVSTMENKLTTFLRSNLSGFISKQATKYRYISPDELKSYQNELINNQDKLLLELPYVGIRGRIAREGTLEEIINLQVDVNDEDFKNNSLKLVRNNGEVRVINISDRTKKLITDTLNDDMYYCNNITSGHQFIINSLGNYVLRTPSKKKNELLNPNLINSRFYKIKYWLGNKYLSISSLYMSGMITKVKEIIKSNGYITNDDLKNICDIFDYKNNGVYKLVDLRTLIDQYLGEVKYGIE